MSKLKTSEINAQPYIGDTKPAPDTNIPEAYVGRLYYAKDTGITYRLVDDTLDANVWASLEVPSEIISASATPTFNNVPDGSIWNDTHKYDAQKDKWLVIKSDNVPTVSMDEDAGYDIGHEIAVGSDIYRLWDNKAGKAVWARLDNREPDTNTSCSPTNHIGYGATLYKCYGDGNWYNYDTNTLTCKDDPATINPLPKNANIVKGNEKWHTDDEGNLKVDTSTRVPTSADDITAGYNVGDIWTVTPSGDKYKCVDATDGNAKWALLRNGKPTQYDDVDEGFNVGDLWYNEADGKVYECKDNSDDQAIWEELGLGKSVEAQSADSLKSKLTPVDTPPSTRDDGSVLQENDFYFEPELNKTVVYDGSKWTLENQKQGEYLGNFDSVNEPTANNTGDRYINTDTKAVMEWDGASWREVKANKSVLSDRALSADDADNLKSQLTPVNTPPSTRDDGSALQAGDFYFEPKLHKTVVYNGFDWELEGQKQGEYLGNFYSANEPTANNTGDRYINTDTKAVMEWDGASWREVTYKADLNSIPGATETVKGVAKLATQIETDAGLDDTKIVTPKKHKAYHAPVYLNGADLNNITAEGVYYEDDFNKMSLSKHYPIGSKEARYKTMSLYVRKYGQNNDKILQEVVYVPDQSDGVSREVAKFTRGSLDNGSTWSIWSWNAIRLPKVLNMEVDDEYNSLILSANVLGDSNVSLESCKWKGIFFNDICLFSGEIIISGFSESVPSDASFLVMIDLNTLLRRASPDIESIYMSTIGSACMYFRENTDGSGNDTNIIPLNCIAGEPDGTIVFSSPQPDARYLEDAFTSKTVESCFIQFNCTLNVNYGGDD